MMMDVDRIVICFKYVILRTKFRVFKKSVFQNGRKVANVILNANRRVFSLKNAF